MKELGLVLVVLAAMWVWLDKNMFGHFSPAVHWRVFGVLAVVIIIAVALLRAAGRAIRPAKKETARGRAAGYPAQVRGSRSGRR